MDCEIGGGGGLNDGKLRIFCIQILPGRIELTEGAGTKKVGCLFQNFTTRIEKVNFLRRRRLGPCRALKGRPLKPGRTGGIKNEAGVQIQSSEKHFVYDYEISTEAVLA